MQVIEFRIQVPLIELNNYSMLLQKALLIENPLVVNTVESGMSDYAKLPSNQNRNKKSNIFRTVKLYTLPQISSEKIKLISFFKFPYTKHIIKIGSCTITSIATNVNNNENIFFLPSMLLNKRTIVPINLTDLNTWNFTNVVAETILGTPSFEEVPTQLPKTFVYVLLFIPSEINTLLNTIDFISIVKGFVVLLHRKMIKMFVSNNL